MTKAVRIENADTSNYKVRVRTFDKSGSAEPDILVNEQVLEHPAQMTDGDTYIHSDRYIVVDEAE